MPSDDERDVGRDHGQVETPGSDYEEPLMMEMVQPDLVKKSSKEREEVENKLVAERAVRDIITHGLADPTDHKTAFEEEFESKRRSATLTRGSNVRGSVTLTRPSDRPHTKVSADNRPHDSRPSDKVSADNRPHDKPRDVRSSDRDKGPVTAPIRLKSPRVATPRKSSPPKRRREASQHTESSYTRSSRTDSRSDSNRNGSRTNSNRNGSRTNSNRSSRTDSYTGSSRTRSDSRTGGSSRTGSSYTRSSSRTDSNGSSQSDTRSASRSSDSIYSSATSLGTSTSSYYSGSESESSYDGISSEAQSYTEDDSDHEVLPSRTPSYEGRHKVSDRRRSNKVSDRRKRYQPKEPDPELTEKDRKQKEEDELYEKRLLVYEFAQLEKKGFQVRSIDTREKVILTNFSTKVSKKYTLADNIYDMRFEHDKLKGDKDLREGMEAAWSYFLLANEAGEAVLSYFMPFGISFELWHKEIENNEDSFDAPMRRIGSRVAEVFQRQPVVHFIATYGRLLGNFVMPKILDKIHHTDDGEPEGKRKGEKGEVDWLNSDLFQDEMNKLKKDNAELMETTTKAIQRQIEEITKQVTMQWNVNKLLNGQISQLAKSVSAGIEGISRLQQGQPPPVEKPPTQQPTQPQPQSSVAAEKAIKLKALIAAAKSKARNGPPLPAATSTSAYTPPTSTTSSTPIGNSSYPVKGEEEEFLVGTFSEDNKMNKVNGWVTKLAGSYTNVKDQSELRESASSPSCKRPCTRTRRERI